MYGPPGKGRPSTRATLSKASPAASSTVAPSGTTPSGPPVTSFTSSSEEWPPDTSSAMHGAGSGPCSSWSTATCAARWLTPYSGVPSPSASALADATPTSRAPVRPGPAGDGHRVDVGQADAGLGAGALDRRHHRLEVRAAGHLRHHAAEPARARRRWTPPRRPAACGRGPGRRPSRRRRSRSPAPGAGQPPTTACIAAANRSAEAVPPVPSSIRNIDGSVSSSSSRVGLPSGAGHQVDPGVDQVLARRGRHRRERVEHLLGGVPLGRRRLPWLDRLRGVRAGHQLHPGREQRSLAHRVAEDAGEEEQRGLAVGVDLAQVGLHHHGAAGAEQVGRVRDGPFVVVPDPVPVGVPRARRHGRLHDVLAGLGHDERVARLEPVGGDHRQPGLAAACAGRSCRCSRRGRRRSWPGSSRRRPGGPSRGSRRAARGSPRCSARPPGRTPASRRPGRSTRRARQ